MIHPFCFEPMTNEQYAEVIKGLTPLESVVYKALNETVFATGFDTLTMQTDITEAFDKVKEQITPKQFSGICGSLAQKNLYRHIICDGYEFPKKVIFFLGKRKEIRQDIAEIILESEVLIP